MRHLIVVLCLVLAPACGGNPGPGPGPGPGPSPSTFRYAVVVTADAGGHLANAVLYVDNAEKSMTNANGFADTRLAKGSYLVRVEREGYHPFAYTLALDHDTNKDVKLAPVRQPEIRGRLKAQGRLLTYPDGARFDWRGLTAFRLLEQVAHGRESDAVTFMRWGRTTGYNLVRVFAQLDGGMFTLTPQDGQQALGRFLTLAAQEDVYVEIVPLVGTKGDGGGFPKQDRNALRQQVQAVGAACAAVAHCILELANENSHPAQVSDLMDVPFLKELRALVPASIPVSLGSTHGAEDESDIFKDGDYLTVHLDRSRDKWNMVRRVRELLALSENLNKFVVNDEPIKFTSQMPDCAIAFTFGALGHGMNVGTTYHFDEGLQALPATGNAATCATDVLEGMKAVPVGLRYSNAGFGDSPVKEADFTNCVVRVYSFVGGPEERTVPLGIACDPKIVWQNGYTPLGVVAERPGVQVLKVSK